MPQMSPMSWLLLFILFSTIFILFNIMNYYSFIPSTNKSNKTLLKNKYYLNWKW